MKRYALSMIALLAAAALCLPAAAPAARRHKLRFEWASAQPPKAFLDAGTIDFAFKLAGSGTRDLRVDIVRVGSERVRSLALDDVPASVRQKVRWNGLNVLGKPAKRGRYAFKVHNSNGKVVRLKDVPGKRSVELYPFKFPVRGPHSYGDGVGAPRAGHTHQGQDISAACGTKLVAPRGGRVQYRGFQSAAGNYLVMDLWHTSMDAVFMHLAETALYAEGAKVRTGKLIGHVGETGDATGCHLHFELWSAPGWYEGGHFMNPTKKLQKWDSWS
jgi:murein DD-endopeptidase MepM/ murein hydrolase activator NlpD